MSQDRNPLLSENPQEDGTSYKPTTNGVTNRIASTSSQGTFVDSEEPSNTEKHLWITATSGTSTHQRNRTLVLCFDGTGDQLDDDNSNIVQLMAMLRKDDTHQQVVYYQSGIGTYTDPLIRTPIASYVSEILDEALAWNLGAHVKDGYTFLMEHYTLGDKICIFGFSRGAYVARALAGMLQKVGLLPPCNHQQVSFAYDLYKREDDAGLRHSTMFKKIFSRVVSVEFLGVWDTVCSVGFFPRYLPFVHANTCIHYLRHAIALDERRCKFLPQYCVDIEQEAKRRTEREKALKTRDGKKHITAAKQYEDAINKLQAYKEGEPDPCLEVWFAGVHTDVGGGSVKNEKIDEGSLARIPLRWMVRQCFECNTGIIFDAVQLQKIGLRITQSEEGLLTLSKVPPRMPGIGPVQRAPDVSFFKTLLYIIFAPFLLLAKLFKRSKPLTAPEELLEPGKLLEQDEDYEAIEEEKDARASINDQMNAKVLWRIFEWMPWRIKKQKAIVNKCESESSYTWLWNRGQGRKVPRSEFKEGLKIHRSVLSRIEASGGSYVPKIRPTLEREGVTFNKDKPLSYEQWNQKEPEFWQWVE